MLFINHIGLSHDGIYNALSFEKQQLYVPFILASYSAGHCLSFISSIFIEKFTIWTIGYPSKYLLGISPTNYFSVNKK